MCGLGAGARESQAEANERDSQDGLRVFRPGDARSQEQVARMVRFIDADREMFGVEPICEVLPIAPSRIPAIAAPSRGQRPEPRRCSRRPAVACASARFPRSVVCCLTRRD